MKYKLIFQYNNFMVGYTKSFKYKQLFFRIKSGDYVFKLEPATGCYNISVSYKNIRITSSGLGSPFVIYLDELILWQNSKGVDLSRNYQNNSKVELDTNSSNYVLKKYQKEEKVLAISESNDKKLEEEVSALIKSNKDIYRKIKNKACFNESALFEIEVIQENCNQSEWLNEFRELMKLFVKWEEYFEEINEKVTIRTLYKKYPILKNSILTRKEVEELLGANVPSNFEDFIGENLDWSAYKPSTNTMIKEIFQKVKNDISRAEERRRIDRIKEKHTKEKILERYSERLSEIKHLGEISLRIQGLLENFNSDSEEELFIKVEELIDEFKGWEIEYKDFILKNGNENKKIIASKETMEGLLDINNAKYELLEKEDEVYFSMLKNLINEVLYGKNGKIKPTYKDFPLFMEFTKMRIQEFVKCGLLKEEESKILMGDIGCYENVDEAFFRFYSYKEEKGFRN